MQSPRQLTLIHLAIFGAVGPLIGALSLLIGAELFGESPAPFKLGLWLGVTLVSYIYGLPAALVTGWAAARARALWPELSAAARIIRFPYP